MDPILAVIGMVVTLIVGALGGAVFGWNRRKATAEREIKSAEDEATRIVNEAYKSAESKKREALENDFATLGELLSAPDGRAATASSSS